MTMTIDETQIIEIKKWEFPIEIKMGMCGENSFENTWIVIVIDL